MTKQELQVSQLFRVKPLNRSVLGSIKTPVLSLRGGGADIKRKEARKRKFAHLYVETNAQPVTNTSALQDTFSKTASKKLKKDEPAPTASNEKKLKGVNEDTDSVNPVRNKSQRFICFIGA